MVSRTTTFTEISEGPSILPIGVVMYQPEIAGNLGAMIRTAACFAASLHVVEPCGFPFKAREIGRAAMDYGALAPPRRYDSWDQFVSNPAEETGRLILLTTKATTTLPDFGFRSGDMLVLGQESAGVPDHVRESCEVAVRIPLAPRARSLNVATAGAIGLSEMRRQLGWDDQRT